MKNTIQTVRFPVSSVISSPLSNEIRQLVDLALKGDTEAKASLDAQTDPKVLKELAFFGCLSLVDIVSISANLGTMLFDVYMSNTPEPQSPLSKLVYQKRNAELAEMLDKEEIEVPDFAKKTIQKTMLDDTAWSKTTFNAWLDVTAEDTGKTLKRYFPMSSYGIKFFNEVVNSAALALYEEGLL
jgi:hypothetical protein